MLCPWKRQTQPQIMSGSERGRKGAESAECGLCRGPLSVDFLKEHQYAGFSITQPRERPGEASYTSQSPLFILVQP